jgi:hypothetical protein
MADTSDHHAALISADDVGGGLGLLDLGSGHSTGGLDPVQLPLFAAEDTGNHHWLPTVVPLWPIDPPVSFPDFFLHDTSHNLFT